MSPLRNCHIYVYLYCVSLQGSLYVSHSHSAKLSSGCASNCLSCRLFPQRSGILFVPLLWGKAFRRPSMDSRNLDLQCRVHHPVPREGRLLFKKRRYYDCRICLAAATFSLDQSCKLSPIQSSRTPRLDSQWRGRGGVENQPCEHTRHILNFYMCSL